VRQGWHCLSTDVLSAPFRLKGFSAGAIPSHDALMHTITYGTDFRPLRDELIN